MEYAIIKAACAIGAGLCMGIGAIGPALEKIFVNLFSIFYK